MQCAIQWPPRHSDSGADSPPYLSIERRLLAENGRLARGLSRIQCLWGCRRGSVKERKLGIVDGDVEHAGSALGLK